MGLLKNLLLLIAASSCFYLQGQVTWEPTIDIAASHFDNNHPRMAVDRAGDPMVIWGKESDLQFTKWNGTAFSQPVKLNPPSVTIANADWMGPDMAAHGDTVYIVYKQTPENLTTSHIWCIRSLDGGVTFDQPVRVDFTGDSLTRFPTVTTDSLGNPIVAFMKFNPTFGEARWVVTRSEDFGTTFLPDVKASGWSGPSSAVCDCCPGTIVCEGNVVSMIYRDNNNNNRDNWAAVSRDGGRTFTGGFNIDQFDWNLQNCPASGPDGVIVGDTLYTVSMNGALVDELVFYNKTSLTDMLGPEAIPVTPYLFGLIQNYPRMANYERAVAMAWRHSLNFNSTLGIYFTSDITKGFPASYDTIAFNNVINMDVALSKERVFVVWQNNSTNTVKFKTGMYEMRTGVEEKNPSLQFNVFPNPSGDVWNVSFFSVNTTARMQLLDIQGHLLLEQKVNSTGHEFEFDVPAHDLVPGTYFLKVLDGKLENVIKVVKD